MTLPNRSLLHVFLFLFCASLLGGLSCHAWRSALYPESWTPPEDASFYEDAFIQDFSYAGYRRGEASLPVVEGPVFDAVDDFGADPSGTRDSTDEIQAAIDAAGAFGGGVVYLQAGTYGIAPSEGAASALRIQHSGTVLRGAGVEKTFLLNDSYTMRKKSVLLIKPSSLQVENTVTLVADLPSPTHRIPVEDASGFEVGDLVLLQWAFTEAWIEEHGQTQYWSPPQVPKDARYLREVTAVDVDADWIEVDIPTRYSMKTRDDARVSTVSGMLSHVGVEDLSIGNVQHPGTEWGEEDYRESGKAAYDAHGSWLIRMEDAYDSWIRSVESFPFSDNSTTCHMLSNGILLVDCFRITVADCAMRRPQFGGGGGNGYLFRIQNSNETLIRDCVGEFSRHGFVLSSPGSSGNVFLRCEDRDTQRATGATGSYQPLGSGSDHHMHFSHSNLFDQCSAHNSYYTASFRWNWGSIPHALTSAHGVYWNTRGSGKADRLVRSEQGRYGYVIGTSGELHNAENPTNGNTAPADLLEGIGRGETLEPQSLYTDQLEKRLDDR